MNHSYLAATLPSRDGYVDVRGLRLHYVDYGGDGEPLVALHGLIQNARAFEAIAPILTPHVHLIALDLRGRGGSAWGPPERYTWKYYLSDLIAVLSTLGLTRFALLGSSLGGVLAMMYAISHPANVTRLVLNDVGLDMNFLGLLIGAERTAHLPTSYASVAEAADWYREHRTGMDCLSQADLEAWVGHYLVPHAEGGLRYNCDPVIMDPDVLGMTIGLGLPWSPGEKGWQQAMRLTMPVLILRGGQSQVLLPEDAARMAERLPAARWVEVPGAAHAPTLYEPVARAALRDFFNVDVSARSLPE